jgi:hypothetical protein
MTEKPLIWVPTMGNVEALPFDEINYPYPKPFDNLVISTEDVKKRAGSLYSEYEPLPFGEIETYAHIAAEIQTISKAPLSLAQRLEAYEPKSELMIYIRLNSAGISATKVRDMILTYRIGYPDMSDWILWKKALTVVTGKSWPECAELIYGEMF